eukprot:m.344703 g.344703  ORF g.344703 m.344703 type:complete len:94 (+) comp16552_c0_seq12:1723-2004(+)
MTSEEIARNEASIKLHKILFTKVLLSQAVAYVRGEDVTHKLVGKQEHVIPVVETCHYAFRGQQLWGLSAMRPPFKSFGVRTADVGPAESLRAH